MGSLWPKYIMLELKQYRGVIFHDTKELCKIWRKTDLWFKKWHEKFGKFSPEHLKVSKLGFWWDLFAQSRKCMNLKFTEELCAMTIKNDTKIEVEMTCRFKIDKEFHEVWPKYLKVYKSCVLMGSLWPKYIMFELNKRYRGVIYHDTEVLCKIWKKKLTCG